MLQDLRYSIRTLRHNPGFTILSILILSLGIGTSASIFSFVNSIVLRPLPFPEPEQLVVLHERNPEKGRLQWVVSPRNLEDWERLSGKIEQFGAWRDWGFRLSTPEGQEGVYGGIASPGLFKLLGIKPSLGRTFLPEENQPGQNQVVLLSHSYWQGRFGSDPDIIGRSLMLSNRSYTVVGVLPPEIGPLGFGDIKIWAPLSIDPDQFLERHHRNRSVFARLKEGVTITEAQAELDTIAKQLAEQYPDENAGWGISVTSLHDYEVGSIRPTLYIFLGAVGLLLLIACANVANLLLARAATRRKEFAVRAALGAERFRIVRLLLIESLLVALIGGMLGLFLTAWILDLIVAINPGNIPRIKSVKIDQYVLFFTFLVSVSSAVLFGLLPGIRASRLDLVTELKDGKGYSLRSSGFLPRSLFVVAQVALALVLLIGAGLLTRTFVRLLYLQTGFDPENILTVQLFVPMNKYKKAEQVAAVYQQVTEEFRSIPAVKAVSTVSAGPQFGGLETVEFLISGQALPSTGVYPVARFYDVGPNYFSTMGIPLLKGRDFTDLDNPQAPAIAIINETMARLHLGGQDPIGKKIKLAREDETLEIVGVVGDVKRYGINSQVEPEIYWPYLQKTRWAIYFVFRTTSDPIKLVPEIRSRVSRLDKDLFVSNIQPMDRLISTSLRQPRFNMFLLGVFAIAALLLASAGIYGLISYSVAQGTHEIGIRMALGAQSKDVLKLVIKQGMFPVIMGVAIGIILAIALTRVMSSILYGIAATDLATFFLISLLISLVSLLACYLPARRATRVDPMTALRCE